MWVTRALKKMRVARLFMGISVCEVSRLKGGVYSFLTVYNTSYVVKKTAEIWAKECENGVQKKVFGHFLIKTGSELTLPGYDVVK